jgi:hypothetical protein
MLGAPERARVLRRSWSLSLLPRRLIVAGSIRIPLETSVRRHGEA